MARSLKDAYQRAAPRLHSIYGSRGPAGLFNFSGLNPSSYPAEYSNLSDTNQAGNDDGEQNDENFIRYLAETGAYGSGDSVTSPIYPSDERKAGNYRRYQLSLQKTMNAISSRIGQLIR